MFSFQLTEVRGMLQNTMRKKKLKTCTQTYVAKWMEQGMNPYKGHMGTYRDTVHLNTVLYVRINQGCKAHNVHVMV